MEIIELNANSVDPDQTPRSAASDLGLHCLPMFLLWDARHKWVKDSHLTLLCDHNFLICQARNKNEYMS